MIREKGILQITSDNTSIMKIQSYKYDIYEKKDSFIRYPFTIPYE